MVTSLLSPLCDIKYTSAAASNLPVSLGNLRQIHLLPIFSNIFTPVYKIKLIGVPFASSVRNWRKPNKQTGDAHSRYLTLFPLGFVRDMLSHVGNKYPCLVGKGFHTPPQHAEGRNYPDKHFSNLTNICLTLD